MSAFPSTIPVKLDDAGRIAVDVPCPACGYNLRMQPIAAVSGAGGVCPECGSSIDVSERLDADRLDAADPAWRARVGRGVRWLHTGAWLSLLGLLPGVVVAAAALWLVTAKEPGRRETWLARGTRLSARWASVLAAAAAAAVGVMFIVRRERLRPSITYLVGEDWGVFDLLICTAGAAAAVALLEAWRLLFVIAARADGPAAARRCRQVWKRYLVAVGAVVFVALVTNAAQWFDIRLPSPLFEWTTVITMSVLAAILLWVWWVTVGLTRSLVRVIGQGETAGV